MAKTSQAKLAANARYDKKTYEPVALVMRRDSGLSCEVLREHAKVTGESLNGFLLRAIAETVRRDKAGDEYAGD